MIMLLFAGLALGWGLAATPWLLILLWPWARKWIPLLAALALGSIVVLYTHFSLPSPYETKETGTGFFRIQDVKEEESPFGRNLVYSGVMLHFSADSGKILKNVPCRIYHKSKQKAPPANCDYLLTGTLSPKKEFRATFKPLDWQPVENSFSFAKWRRSAKDSARSYLQKHFGGSSVFPLFCALTLGEIDDRQLAGQFRNLGLSHILAISGFHFALTAALIIFALRFLFPRRAVPLLALGLLAFYAFFLGESPSILRAWAAISLFLFGKWKGYKTTGLNALGFGLIVEILANPLLASQVGFSLSFLATASILLLYSPCEKFLQLLFVPRTLSTLEEFSSLHKHLYLISCLLRKALALNVCVHLATIPACLLFFGSFPWLSLLYNLFYPFLISLSMTALMVTTPIDLIFPLVGGFLHACNRSFTESLIGIVAHPPGSFRVQTEAFSPWLLSLWLLLLIAFCLFFDKKREKPLLS